MTTVVPAHTCWCAALEETRVCERLTVLLCGGCAPLTYEQTKEGAIVAVANAVVDPRAVMVHTQHTSVAHTTVVGTWGLVVAALLAEAGCTILQGSTHAHAADLLPPARGTNHATTQAALCQ
jgi:hypothetical protein